MESKGEKASREGEEVVLVTCPPEPPKTLRAVKHTATTLLDQTPQSVIICFISYYSVLLP